VGVFVAYKVLPVAYHWELIPGVSSPLYYEKAKKIKYDNYDRGFVYDSFGTGTGTMVEIDESSIGKIQAPVKKEWLEARQG